MSKHAATQCDKANGRSANEAARHVYPIAMWRMAADVMGSLPGLMVSLETVAAVQLPSMHSRNRGKSKHRHVWWVLQSPD